MAQSEFNALMVEANKEIMNAFSTEYLLTLCDASTSLLNAIYDTKLITKTGEKSAFKEMKNGLLIVHNIRLDRDVYMNAKVTTVLGPRVVSDVMYTCVDTSILILSALKKAETSNSDYF